ncbi:hypothetical protein B9Z55_027392 [Caenorhabditis nigoni]|nr:hypothetical protein B9Z55_027392 [Caenorhabditis nigoni]
MNVHATEISHSHGLGQLEIRNKPKTNQFPLLKFPRVVLLECIENLDVLEIILFSLLSKRAKANAKLVHWTPLDIVLRTESPIEINLKCPIYPYREWTIEFNEEKESSEYPYFESYQTGPIVENFLFLKNNENAIEDSKQLTEHICEVFSSPVSGVDLGEESQIKWISKFQQIFRKVWIWDDVITSVETLYRVLNDVKVTDYVFLGSVAIDENFQIRVPIPAQQISIRNSYWLTLPSILNGTNSMIRLHGSKLTPKEINTILKEWKMGSKLCNLEYLEIDTVAFQDAESYTNEILKDLDWTDGNENDGRPTTVKLDGEWTDTLPQVKTVRNLTGCGGKIGSIFETFGDFEDGKLELCFYFQVWSRQN